MTTPVLTQIFDKIKAYDRIMLFRHVRMDGDCTGAVKGLKGLITATWPHKEVYIIDGQTSDYLSFMGEDDAPIDDALYADALGIVIDTASVKRISSDKYALCKELIKIDHHIDVEQYGDIAWVEEDRSSACEMIAAFYAAFRQELVLTQQAATHIYTGMVTDSGRFQYEGVTGDTLRLAALMLDAGIDTETLYAHLYLRDFASLKFKAYIYEHMQLTENGVAYLYVDRAMQKQFHLSFETASAAISYLDSIRGSLIWLAFIENPDSDEIRVRLRSRFVTVNQLAERYHGGGHACASGATVYSREEMQQLLQEADKTLKDYKATHEGWL